MKIALLRVLLWILPAGRHAVVAGAPDDEGNSVETVRALSRRMKVYWLVNDAPEELAWMLDGDHARRNVRWLPKHSWRAFMAYVTARYIFFTHGLYGSPRPPRHKTIVNLWHGDGPKQRKGFADIRSTYVVSGTERWGRPRAAAFHVPDSRVLVTGNPRVDQLARPTGDDALARLDLPPDRPLVLWLPTYRTTEYRGKRMGTVRNWSDGAELSRTATVRGLLDQFATVAADLGVTFLVKPHVLDADRFAEAGIRCLTGEELRAARTTLYELLGRSSGLLTDYSSVWTDYLVVDRPIGFYCPDLEEYEQQRGLNVTDYPTWVPGPMLESADDFARFLGECREESEASRRFRHGRAAQIGARTEVGAADRLLDALDVTRGSRRSVHRP